MKWKPYCRFICAMIGMISAAHALGYDEPQVNLGLTSFLDGAPPAGPGLYIEEYLQYYAADRLNDNNGNKLPLPRQKVDMISSVTQFLYLSPTRFLGGNPGFDLLLPAILGHDIDDGLNNAVLKGQSGVGDVIFGPLLQFGPYVGPNGPIFSHRFELDISAPTGAYNHNNAMSPGSHFWSINPYWAGTFWLTPKLTASVRFHYLWNSRNSDPNASFGPDVTSTQAGQALHANFAIEYTITPTLRLGVNAYWFNQISDTKVNGSDAEGRRERVWAIGPGMLCSFSKDDHLFLNAYFEQGARNRSEGNRFVARYVHHF
ncbi:protein involved in meta-pathway of phenol degradation-like protein [Caballeronia terrestris]|uniref:Protein involved in meta-pathway of phenol degradation-like protein n=2 Tax=Caballeronia terrestris TaxID=1226301 RepID=A0A158GKW8_9BURK|nr:transporter [Caballeronia terrestris]SAL32259.1 protein involved in meta-pathway of phenol degradation-like protein [Caballeronia terrestris]